MSIKTRLNNIEKTAGAAAEVDKPVYAVMVHGDTYSFNFNGENFTGTQADYNAYKAAHSIDDSNSIMIHVISA